MKRLNLDEKYTREKNVERLFRTFERLVRIKIEVAIEKQIKRPNLGKSSFKDDQF